MLENDAKDKDILKHIIIIISKYKAYIKCENAKYNNNKDYDVMEALTHTIEKHKITNQVELELQKLLKEENITNISGLQFNLLSTSIDTLIYITSKYDLRIISLIKEMINVDNVITDTEQ